jgi:hypothetical protein
VITYRELRLLELAVLRASITSGQQVLDVQTLINVDVDQFYGIEIEEFPAQIAQVALWLTDHQMNMKISEEFGAYFARIPLKATPHIICGNALQTDWASVLPPERCSFVLGNPPFLGKKEQSVEQKADMQSVCGQIKSAGILDFVSAWYVKAARYMHKTSFPEPVEGMGNSDNSNHVAIPSTGSGNGMTTIRCAFVSTNSITQGEQVGVLWAWMLAQGIKIHFAHRTFSWNNEARGNAAVHCVIIGFGLQDVADKIIYEYDDIKGEPHAVKARNINPYLVDAADSVLVRRSKPLDSQHPAMSYGSMPIDNGWLLLTDSDKNEALKIEPHLKQYLRPYYGGEEFLNNIKRWCLWLVDANPSELRASKFITERLRGSRQYRESSSRPQTLAMAKTPGLFGEIRHSSQPYLLLPKVSSENRRYMPMGFMSSNAIASGSALIIANANLMHFGILQSAMHMA